MSRYYPALTPRVDFAKWDVPARGGVRSFLEKDDNFPISMA
jgi:hypothetical protein